MELDAFDSEYRAEVIKLNLCDVLDLYAIRGSVFAGVSGNGSGVFSACLGLVVFDIAYRAVALKVNVRISCVRTSQYHISCRRSATTYESAPTLCATTDKSWVLFQRDN